MNTKTKIVLTLLTLGTTASMLLAQDGQPQDGQRPPRPQGQGQGGPGMGGHRPPPPLITALDANHDGVIDADEIANASTALKTLDKNGDGQLTQDELRPARPEGNGPAGGRPAPPQDNQ